MSKRDHVLSSKQTRPHGCHWPGCTRQVAPALWGCPAHWFQLPFSLRNRIWETYVPGQEERLDPSPAYLAVARDVQAWIRANKKGKA